MDIEQVERAVQLIERSQLHEVTIVDGDQSTKSRNPDRMFIVTNDIFAISGNQYDDHCNR